MDKSPRHWIYTLIPEAELDKPNVYMYGYLLEYDDQIIHLKAPPDLHHAVKNAKHLDDKNYELVGDIKYEKVIFDKIGDNPLSIKLDEFFTYHINQLIRGGDVAKEWKGKIKKMNAWINVMKAGEYQPLHSHQGEFSWVWYTDVPEEIRKECELNEDGDGKYARGLIQFYSKHTSQTLTFNPKEGDIFLFRSSHQHQVYPFYSDNTRISVAGNIHL